MAHGHHEHHAHDHDHEDHEHADLVFERVEAEDADVETLKPLQPHLAVTLMLGRRAKELNEEEKKAFIENAEKALEGAFVAGFHAEGDTCAACGEPTRALFKDVFEGGASLEYAVFASELPVHPTCAADLVAEHPKLAKRDHDRLRREHLGEMGARPSPEMATFFRRDLVAHPSLDVHAWVESVWRENREVSDNPRAFSRDLQRLLDYVHDRVF